MKYIIRVTKKNIRDYVTRDLTKHVSALTECAVAMAIKRNPDLQVRYVGVRTATINNIDIRLPEFVANNIHKMCGRQEVKPFQFTITL